MSLSHYLKRSCLLALILSLTLASGCSKQAQGPEQSQSSSVPKVKYVFLMIGDGMGVAQRAVAENYKRIESGSQPGEPEGQLVMNQLPVKGLTNTNPHGAVITDSAASATALGCGQKTYNGAIGIGPDKTTKLKSVAYYAKDAGKKVGIVSSVPLDHATPGAFYACQPSRGQYYEIAAQLPESGFNYFAGESFIGDDKKYREDKKPAVELAQAAGYAYYKNEEGLEKIKKGDDKILWQSSISYGIDTKPGDVTLADLVKKGIEVMEDNKEGFFMMVEGGKIDWTGHANDLAGNVKETLAFDDAVKVAYDFYLKHPDDTLIVITGDHETGGLNTAFKGGFSPKEFAKAINSQKTLGSNIHEKIKSLKDADPDEAYVQICEAFGLTDMTKEEEALLKNAITLSLKTGGTAPDHLKAQYGNGKKNMISNTCQTIIAKRCGITWTTFGHSGTAVVTTAVGPGSKQFAGQTDNTDIALNLRQAVLQPKEK